MSDYFKRQAKAAMNVLAGDMGSNSYVVSKGDVTISVNGLGFTESVSVAGDPELADQIMSAWREAYARAERDAMNMMAEWQRAQREMN